MPFQIRGRSFTAVVLQMTGAADAEFYRTLDAKLAQAPHFFTNAPFVIDLDRAVGLNRSGDFTGLVRELRARKLSVIGVQNGTIEQNAGALTAGLITLQGGRDLPQDGAKALSGHESSGNEPSGDEAEDRPREQPIDRNDRVAVAAEAAEPAAGGTVLITEPVRSGQRIFADRGDLVVVASVGSGAELVAHGNVHIYGSMRGRALAGVNGDTSARIFCQSLEAELIAIAGLYKTSDDIGPAAWKQRVQAFLDEDALCVEPLK